MELIQNLLQQLDVALANYVLNAFANLSPGLGVLWTSMGILLVTFLGLRFMLKGNFEPDEFLIQLFKMVIIYALITVWGDFSAIVYDLLTNLPSELGATIIGHDPEDGTIVTFLDSFIDDSAQAAENVTNDASGIEETIIAYILAFMIWIGIFLFAGYATFLIVLSKMATAILLAVAPIFILLLMFRQSNNLFEGWLKTTLNFAMIPLFVYALLALIIGLINVATDHLVTTTSGAGAGTNGAILHYLIYAFIGYLLLLQVMTFTANIAGGFALSTMNAASRIRDSYYNSKAGIGKTARGIGTAGQVTAVGARGAYAAASVRSSRNFGSAR